MSAKTAMSDKPDDIDAYCARIGYSGPREATLAVVQTLVAVSLSGRAARQFNGTLPV